MDESPHAEPREIDVELEPSVRTAARRHRAVAGVVAAMLVAGSGGLGFGLGRSLSDGDAAPAAEPPTTGAATAQTAVHAIDELVFTAPDRAWFRYSIDTDMSFFGDRFGVAKLTGDGWIFPRALTCQDLSLAGVNCDPPVETIYPPSWYEVNLQQCTYDDTGAQVACVGYEDSAIATW